MVPTLFLLVSWKESLLSWRPQCVRGGIHASLEGREIPVVPQAIPRHTVVIRLSRWNLFIVAFHLSSFPAFFFWGGGSTVGEAQEVGADPGLMVASANASGFRLGAYKQYLSAFSLWPVRAVHEWFNKLACHVYLEASWWRMAGANTFVRFAKKSVEPNHDILISAIIPTPLRDFVFVRYQVHHPQGEGEGWEVTAGGARKRHRVCEDRVARLCQDWAFVSRFFFLGGERSACSQ